MKLLLKTLVDITFSTGMVFLGVLLTVYAYQTDPFVLEQFSQISPHVTIQIAYWLLGIMLLAASLDWWFIQRKAQ